MDLLLIVILTATLIALGLYKRKLKRRIASFDRKGLRNRR